MDQPAADRRLKLVQDRRRASRFAVTADMKVRRRGDSPTIARLFDLSEGGCRFQTLVVLHAGDTVWVQIGDFASVEARVVWTHDMFAGVAFARPLHASVIDYVLKTAPAPAERVLEELSSLGIRCAALADRRQGYDEAAHLAALSRDLKVEVALARLVTRLDTAPAAAAGRA